MIIALAYCDKDICQALRWMQWVSRLGASKSPIALCFTKWASAQRAHKEILVHAERCFSDVRPFVPPREIESGWPASPNFMFKSALEFCSGQDVLWMEPDAIPVDPDWARIFAREWEEAQANSKQFMGSLSKFGTPHMTGIGVYSARWREFAPQLAAVPDHEPFDSYGGKAVLDNAWLTGLIQHRGADHPIQSLDQLDADAVIYHPDKDGRLLAMLDADMFCGECSSTHGWSGSNRTKAMARQFYHAENTNRAVRAGNLRFNFESYACFGGAWSGVYTTEIETEIAALNQLASNPRTSVKIIPQSEYEKATQKKMPTVSHAPFPQRKEIPIQGPGAVVVDNPVNVDTTAQPSSKPVADNIDDVLVIGNVLPDKPEKPDKPERVEKVENLERTPRPKSHQRRSVFGSQEEANE